MTSTAEITERINKCRKILSEDPNSQIFAALAEAFRKKGDLNEAFRVCQSGLKIHPSYGAAHIVMAKINLDKGLYDWAMVEAKKAADIDGKTRTVELLLSEIYIYKGEFNDAIKLLTKLQMDDPDNYQINKLLEIAKKIPEEQKLIAKNDGVPSKPSDTGNEETVMYSKKAEEKPPEPPKPAERLTSLDIISHGIAIPGVDGVIQVNREGLSLESEWTMQMDEALCAATLGDLSLLLTQELVESSFGNFETVLIESAGYTFYIKRFTEGLFIFVASEKTNLGGLRMKIDKLLDAYSN
ncbi:MAG: hypothetical protein DWP97_14585 [Calditrichaeota bacterium]|nr:MAG: hypothetical protein DWP97_14585 [Calditrichota bacterium]